MAEAWELMNENVPKYNKPEREGSMCPPTEHECCPGELPLMEVTIHWRRQREI